MPDLRIPIETDLLARLKANAALAGTPLKIYAASILQRYVDRKTKERP